MHNKGRDSFLLIKKSLAYIIHIRKSFPVFAITAITKISK